jgi:hypothetical protein
MRAVVAAAHAVVALGDADDIGATTTTHSEAEAAAIASVGQGPHRRRRGCAGRRQRPT